MIFIDGFGKFIVFFFTVAVLSIPCKAQTWQVLDPSSSQNLFESEHFVVRFNNDDGVTLNSSQIQNGLNQLEKYWKFYVDTLRFTPPYDGISTKYKVDVWLSNSGYASGAGTGERHPAMWVSNDGYLAGDWALVHELAHCFQFSCRSFRDSKFVGWFWETHAEFMASLYTNEVRQVEFQINTPHLHAGSTRFRYGQWLFLEYLKDEYGISVINDMWNKAYKPENPSYLQEEPFLVLARNLGWTQSELNDHFAKCAMRNVTWDYKRKSIFAKAFSYNEIDTYRRGRLTLLDTVNLSKRRFQVSHWGAPQRWGYNLVRLYPDAGATNVKIIFQGVIQTEAAISKFDAGKDLPSSVPVPHSGWRWGIVAVSRDGSPRYSQIQASESGTLNIEVNSSDSSLWLLVMGAPSQNESLFWNQAYNSIYRYPWMVQFENAYPQGFQPGADSLPIGIKGARHVNGGGWVASTANVAATAYIGTHAIVLGNARVQDKARIDGYACIKGNAIVKDTAIVTDRAIVSDNAIIYGNATICGAAGVYGSSKVFDKAIVKNLSCVTGTSNISGNSVVGSVEYASFNNRKISGTAQALADIDLTKDLTSGIYIGGEISTSSDDQLALSRIKVPGEVTALPPYVWNEEVHTFNNPVAITRKSTETIKIAGNHLRINGYTDGILTIHSFDLSGKMVWEKKVLSKNGKAEMVIPCGAEGWRHFKIINKK